MFRICVIGCGFMATDGHGPAYAKYAAEHEETFLAACCDIDPERAETFRTRFGFARAYTDYRVMLDEVCPDAVCLLSPVQFTCELAVEVLKKGYALFLEKPPGRNREEIEQIYAQAKQAQVSVWSAFNRRYTPLITRLKSLLEGEQILNITYQMYRRNRRDPDFATTAIHAIDAVSHIAGAPYRYVDFTYQRRPEWEEYIANAYLTGQMENGCMAQLSIIPMGGTTAERITVNTDCASYFVELPFWSNPDSPGRLRRLVGNDVTHDISGADLVDSCEMFEESGFYEENRRFFEHLRGGEPVSCDLQAAIQPVEIADCLRNRARRYNHL